MPRKPKITKHDQETKCPDIAQKPKLRKSGLTFRQAHPLLAAELHPTKNPRTADELPAGGGREPLWWVCSGVKLHGHNVEVVHEWLATSSNRIGSGKRRPTGCPFCAGRLCPCGCNSLLRLTSEDRYKSAPKEWSEKKNHPITLADISSGSNHKCWWICQSKEKTCQNGQPHVYLMSPKDRFREKKPRNCNVCSGKVFCTADACNALHVRFPHIFAQIDVPRYEKLFPNNDIWKITYGKKEKIPWICNNICLNGEPHRWMASVRDRTRQDKPTNCPICSGNKVCSLDMCNSEEFYGDDFIDEWDDDKLTPFDVTPGCSTKIGWRCTSKEKKCLDGSPHHYKSTLCNRRLGQGCGICESKIICPRDACNSLAKSLLPVCIRITAEWNPKNRITPDKVFPNSTKQVWWICANNHEWKTSPNSRVNQDLGCPMCSETSGERAVRLELEKSGVTFLSQHKIMADEDKKMPYKLDFYLPELSKAIEFDGVGHFESIEHWGGMRGLEDCQRRDRLKDEWCLKNNIILLRIHYADISDVAVIIAAFIMPVKFPLEMPFVQGNSCGIVLSKSYPHLITE